MSKYSYTISDVKNEIRGIISADRLAGCGKRAATAIYCNREVLDGITDYLNTNNKAPYDVISDVIGIYLNYGMDSVLCNYPHEEVQA